MMNGLDAARVLKRVMPEVPVIMYSAYSDSATESEARSAGVWALVSKSENVSVLLDRARGALEPQSGRMMLSPPEVVGRGNGWGPHPQLAGRFAIMSDLQLAKGDICADPAGLRVRVEDVDIYDYVRFSVNKRSDSGEDKEESGQISHVAFVHRFTKLGNTVSDKKVA